MAIKCVKLKGDGLPAELIKEISILKEMKVMTMLDRIDTVSDCQQFLPQHDKIVKLYGVLHEERVVKLVMEVRS